MHTTMHQLSSGNVNQIWRSNNSTVPRYLMELDIQASFTRKHIPTIKQQRA